jgi:hypothetical protein
MIEFRVTTDDSAVKALKAAHVRAVARATVAFWEELQRVLNVPNTAIYRRGKPAIYPNPSKPGEPPRKRTGWLANNVTYQFFDGGERSRVGITENALYGLFLEKGTLNLQPRPWLLVTAQRMAPALAAIVEKEVSRVRG